MLHEWQDILSTALSYTGTFSAGLVLVLFSICLIGEAIGISFPYLLETIWLMPGYHAINGSLSPLQLLILLLVAQIWQTSRDEGSLQFKRKGYRLFGEVFKVVQVGQTCR